MIYRFTVSLSAALIFSLPAQAEVSIKPGVGAQIDSLRQRASQAVDTGQMTSVYMSTKAQAWLDFAFEEYIERDNTGLVEDAVQRAEQLTGWLEQKLPEGAARPDVIRGTTRVREDLWAALAMGNRQGCAAPYLARAEVLLVWGGHEIPELGMRHARRYLKEAEQLLRDAERVEQDCLLDEIARKAALAKPEEMAALMLPESVHFAYKQDDISAETEQVLQDLAETLRTHPALRLELVGHTDRIGGEEYNLKLSQRRAARIKQRLSELGVPDDRFLSRGMGRRQLLKLPEGSDANAHDRRVEFVIIDDPATESSGIRMQAQDADLQPGGERIDTAFPPSNLP
ncbi:MAG: OmpA family protein [Gallionella sp.]|nr:OmpA family protein [Gallionella sp.]